MDLGNDFNLAVAKIEALNKIEIRTLSDKIVKFNEEFGEFCAEIIKAQGLTPKPYDEEHLIEEAADSLQMLLSIIINVCKEKDIPFEKILPEVIKKCYKWEKNIPNYTKQNEGNTEE